MKQYLVLTFVIGILAISTLCNAQTDKTQSEQKSAPEKIDIYYFHFTHRCATCLAVEENARKAVLDLYGNEVKAGDYTFSSINLDDANSKKTADKLGIGGQTLMVVFGEKKIDITDKGFLNARNYEKIKEEIKSAVDKILL